MDDVTITTTPRSGGRGARERILDAATDLFYWHGINATGVEALAERAHVSKRTLYHHFASKDDLAVAYLQRFGSDKPDPITEALARDNVPPRQRLLDVFAPLPGTRGCPYLNASAELAEDDHPARAEASARKQAFIDDLVRVSREAGASDPQRLGHQLAVLSDGARAQGAALRSVEPVEYARELAEQLIDSAIR